MALGIFEFVSTANLVTLHDAVIAALIAKTNRVVATVGIGDNSTSKVDMVPTKELLEEIAAELRRRNYGGSSVKRTSIRYV